MVDTQGFGGSWESGGLSQQKGQLLRWVCVALRPDGLA